MSDDTNQDDEDQGPGILDVKVALETVFKGCKVHLLPSLGGSFHAELSFYEYEIRVILSGLRAKDRKIHYRFIQRVGQPEGRKPTKRMILEIETTDPDQLVKAIEDTKAHLLGIVYAITKALRPPNVPRVSGIDDLFKDG